MGLVVCFFECVYRMLVSGVLYVYTLWYSLACGLLNMVYLYGLGRVCLWVL